MLSASKIGQFAATGAAAYVAYNVTKPATRWVFDKYNNFMHKTDASTAAPKSIKLGYYQSIALKIIPAAAALVAGAATYKNIGWIASGLAARVSTMFGSSETAKKVEVAVTGSTSASGATTSTAGVTAVEQELPASDNTTSTTVVETPVVAPETTPDSTEIPAVEQTDVSVVKQKPVELTNTSGDRYDWNNQND